MHAQQPLHASLLTACLQCKVGQQNYLWGFRRKIFERAAARHDVALHSGAISVVVHAMRHLCEQVAGTHGFHFELSPRVAFSPLSIYIRYFDTAFSSPLLLLILLYILVLVRSLLEAPLHWLSSSSSLGLDSLGDLILLQSFNISSWILKDAARWRCAGYGVVCTSCRHSLKRCKM